MSITEDQPIMANAARKLQKPNRQQQRAAEVVLCEADALKTLAAGLQIDDYHPFSDAVQSILSMRGRLIVLGIGKAGWVGQKIAATFASTGTSAHFVHPSEAVHGDLGRIHTDDVVLILSNSGTSLEIVRILDHLKSHCSAIIAITSNLSSPLALAADFVLTLPKHPEACSNGLAPTTSTTCMMALGDSLAIVVSDERGFASADFAKYHPGGSLGNQLKTVNELMRPIHECRVAEMNSSIREVLVGVARPGRRSGAVMLVDDAGKLQGIFTDSDLAKLLERRLDQTLDEPISQMMIRKFSAVQSNAMATDALTILAQKKISELPVVDSDDKPIGMVDITDLIGFVDSKELASHEESNCSFENYSPATLRIFC
jgi:arabinose-5-phosphate isomerase